MARKKSSEQSTAMTFSHAVRQCVDSGKVEFGANTGVKRALSGKAKLVVISDNCPSEVREDVMRFCKLSGVPTAVFEGTSVELRVRFWPARVPPLIVCATARPRVRATSVVVLGPSTAPAAMVGFG